MTFILTLFVITKLWVWIRLFQCVPTSQILEGRTERRQIGSRAGNTFSVATFAVDDNPRDGDQGGRRGKRGGGNDADYWRSLLPEAAAAHEARVRGEESQGSNCG